MSASDLYPFASQDGQAIPLDIIKPKSLVPYLLDIATGLKTIIIPATFSTVVIYSTMAVLLRMDDIDLPDPGGVVDGTEYLNTMLIPAYTFFNMVVNPGHATVKVIGSVDNVGSTGILWMMSVEQWAGLNQKLQAAIG